jgi:hypothetical protein
MSTFTTEFDLELGKILHFKNYPAMFPYIGINYGKGNNPKILLIAESHYLPEGSSVSCDEKKWYSEKMNLKNEEKEWIHTRGVLESDWRSRGHVIFKKLERCLQGYFKMDGSTRAMTNVCYMNGFQRPSPQKGESISKCLTELDCEISSDTLSKVINIINPDIVIFVSKLSWEKLHSRLKLNTEIAIEYTCHPSTVYWERASYKHGKQKFNDILKPLFSESI